MPRHDACFNQLPTPKRGVFRCHESDPEQGLRVEIMEPNYYCDTAQIRIGSKDSNGPIYIDKYTAGVLHDFFTDLEAALPEKK